METLISWPILIITKSKIVTLFAIRGIKVTQENTVNAHLNEAFKRVETVFKHFFTRLITSSITVAFFGQLIMLY